MILFFIFLFLAIYIFFDTQKKRSKLNINNQSPIFYWESNYESFHSMPEQWARQGRAKEYKPIKIDNINKKCIFKGSSGNIYTTTLYLCNCPDFKERVKPCKHMYRLAHEFKLFDLSLGCLESINKNEGLAKINSLSENAQIIFTDILYCVIYHPEKYPLIYKNDNTISELSKLNLVKKVENTNYILSKKFTKKDLSDSLFNPDIKINKNTTKQAIIDLLITENQENANEIANKYTIIEIPEEINNLKHILYRHLKWNH